MGVVAYGNGNFVQESLTSLTVPTLKWDKGRKGQK